MTRPPGRPRRCRYATKMLVTGLVLAGAAGCSGSPAVARNSVTSCYQVAATAIQRHITLTAMPAACQGLSQVEVNQAVSRALRAAAAGVRGKVRQRELIARDSRYVADLIRAVPASSPPAVTTQPSWLPSHAALSLAALISWLVTIGLGVSMMARWITRIRRPGRRPRRERGPVLNFTHFGLALTGLLAWISYLATGLAGLAWAGCGLLLAAASLGMTLVFLVPAATAGATGPAGGPPAGGPPTDDSSSAGRPPIVVIAAHITAACITILLATLAAIGSG
jgi:hypothetical protein